MLKVILVATLIAAASAIEITGQAQYDEVTAGKAVRSLFSTGAMPRLAAAFALATHSLLRVLPLVAASSQPKNRLRGPCTRIMYRRM